jgi:hypothetical protein
LIHHIIPPLRTEETNELEGHDICSLVQELIETMLTIGPRFSEDDGAGGVIERFPEPIHPFPVGLHIQLLEMGRKTVQGLAIGEDRGARIGQHVPLVHAQQGIQEGGVLQNVGLQGFGVCLMGPCQQFLEGLLPESQGKAPLPLRHW